MRGAELEIRRNLVIPAGELRETASRAGGPGGQHVNKTSTRVTLRWNVLESAVLSQAQRARLCSQLAHRITRRGELVVHAGRSRVRSRNRERARARLAALVREGLAVRRTRMATRESRASKARALEAKRRRGARKQRRGRVRADEE
ncbi:MAG: alternative ribosome rescue aminoacyl-tRNA hydrolase ArfB [Proteobacteria bacterium]|nr:alternative ribosome rescue aminoacyl-tRNA hydrolase ArfB [Pseudomonadota bacterium]